MKQFTYLFTLAAVLVIPKLSLGQDAIQVDKWQLVKRDAKVEINQKKSICTIPNTDVVQELVYLQFKNLTGEPINVTWRDVLWYGNVCYNCKNDNPEMSHELSLEPFETKSGSCDSKELRQLSIFSKFISLPNKNQPLNRLEIEDIHVLLK